MGDKKGKSRINPDIQIEVIGHSGNMVHIAPAGKNKQNRIDKKAVYIYMS